MHLHSGFLFYIIVLNLILPIEQIYVNNLNGMKKIAILAILMSILIASCARGISPYEAAHGKAKCGRYIK